MAARLVSLPPVVGLALLVPGVASPQELPPLLPESGHEVVYSPYLQQDFSNQVFFGDTHLHTAYSADAGLVGATLTPDDAYRFAKGEEVLSSNGVRARLQRPLDWLVVTDHAKNLGLPVALEEENPVLDQNDWGRRMAEIFGPRTDEARAAAYETWVGAVNTGDDPLAGTEFGRTMWQQVTEAAERHNEPGAFSAIIGFEWTTPARRQQPAPQRHLQGRQGTGRPDRPALRLRHRGSGAALGMDVGLRGAHGRPAARHPPQRQLVERPDVRRRDAVGRAPRRRLCRAPHALGADLRDHPDQGGRRDAPAAVARGRVRRLRHLGQGQFRPRTEDHRHAAARVRALGLAAGPRL